MAKIIMIHKICNSYNITSRLTADFYLWGQKGYIRAGVQGSFRAPKDIQRNNPQ